VSDALTIAALLLAAPFILRGAQRDLQLPMWLTFCLLLGASILPTFPLGLAYAPIGAVVCICLLIVETDRRHHLIPDAFLTALLVLAPVMPFGGDLAWRALGAGVLGGAFYLTRQVFNARRGVDTLGLGDVKLAAVMGALLGPLPGFYAVGIAGVATLLVVAARTRGVATTAGAPFGVGLGAATAVTVLAQVFVT
jgi:leader peptidase (prepilin peptidase)/N-methyltransferase